MVDTYKGNPNLKSALVRQEFTQDQVKDFILNIYYVLLTRARLGTYVYIVDEDLRKYFKDSVLKI